MKILQLLIFSFVAISMFGCQKEQKTTQHGMSQSEIQRLVEYTAIRDNQFVLDLSLPEAVTLGISEASYQKATVELARHNVEIADLIQKGAEVILISPKQQSSKLAPPDENTLNFGPWEIYGGPGTSSTTKDLEDFRGYERAGFNIQQLHNDYVWNMSITESWRGKTEYLYGLGQDFRTVVFDAAPDQPRYDTYYVTWGFRIWTESAIRVNIITVKI